MRPLRDDEAERLRAAVARFGPGVLEAWTSDAALWTDPGPPQRVFLVARALDALLRAAAPGTAPTRPGLFLGELEGERFHPSLEGAHELARAGRAACVVVREKGAQLFLYGRDVLGESVERFDRALRPGDVALIVNEHGEGLGVARVRARLPGHGPVLEPLTDRGWYLREGG